MTDLTQKNRDLLDTEKKMDRSSLQPAIMDAYVSEAKYVEHGVVRYRTKLDEAAAGNVADKVMREASYQIAKRQFNMHDDNMSAVQMSTDANGTRYGDVVVEQMMGIGKGQILKILKDAPNTYDATTQLSAKMTETYGQRTDVTGITNKYTTVPELRNAVVNTNEALGLNALGTVKVDEMGLDELIRTQLQLMGMGRQKEASE
ncbi:hypothetical protein HOC13_01610 [Candidatus Woesearchaeota archaeon]|jgi:hypothetical protein|nr:hypothetical protein [Candidatus Woesearchaeota archaeon]